MKHNKAEYSIFAYAGTNKGSCIWQGVTDDICNTMRTIANQEAGEGRWQWDNADIVIGDIRYVAYHLR